MREGDVKCPRFHLPYICEGGSSTTTASDIHFIKSIVLMLFPSVFESRMAHNSPSALFPIDEVKDGAAP